MKVKATSTNAIPLSAAEAFARLLVVAMSKKPDLQLVKPGDDAESRQKTAPGKRG